MAALGILVQSFRIPKVSKVINFFHLSFLEEADNLSSRLQASRQRVAELERSLASATSSSQQFKKVRTHPAPKYRGKFSFPCGLLLDI